MPSWSRSPSGTLPMTAESQRLTNTDATEPTSGLSPAAIRRSMPRRKASAAATYCSRLNSSVTFTGTPAKIAPSTARQPPFVPGILMKGFGRAGRPGSSFAGARVPAVSGAGSGEASRDTHPSTPLLRSHVGPEHVGGLGEVLDRQLEEQLLAR